MTHDPQDYSGPSEQDHPADRTIQRRQEIELQEEEMRLREEESRVRNAQHNLQTLRITQGIAFLVGALEILLGLRLFLQLAGANRENLFASVIYDWSNPFIAPFATLFPNPSFGGGNVFELTTIIAMIVYGLLGVLATRLVYLIASR